GPGGECCGTICFWSCTTGVAVGVAWWHCAQLMLRWMVVVVVRLAVVIGVRLMAMSVLLMTVSVFLMVVSVLLIGTRAVCMAVSVVWVEVLAIGVWTRCHCSIRLVCCCCVWMRV